jgi:RimJ/RimL family protein N-acetyltransferase
MPTRATPAITLRRTRPEDVRLLFEAGCDEESNRLAGTKPRGWDEFLARWTEILADADGSATGVVPRVILADGRFVGSINIFPQDGLESVGYWIVREQWGRGIASAALALMLAECPTRPLHATASGHNHASLRVLEKHGFAVVSRQWTPETDRARARETVVLALRGDSRCAEYISHRA